MSDPSESGIREGGPAIVPSFPADGPGSPAPLIMLVLAASAVWLGSAIVLGFLGLSDATVGTPIPFPWFVFAFLGVPTWLIAFIPAGAFLAWQPGLWQLKNSDSSVPMPIRTWILLIAVSILSVLYFVAGWEYGLKYQGIDYTWKCAFISAGLALASATLSMIAEWKKDFHLNVLGHAALFYWIASYAFPYLGELP